MYAEGLKLVEERCNNKDNIISLATISTKINNEGKPMPVVRNVDAYYENSTFYIVTNAKSNKMIEIANNNEVAFTVNMQWFSGIGIGENMGWVLEPKNEEIRLKLREVFKEWYDMANDENNRDCIILAIHIKEGIVIKNHGEQVYNLDFINKREL